MNDKDKLTARQAEIARLQKEAEKVKAARDKILEKLEPDHLKKLDEYLKKRGA